jgi:hypothetical protein
MMRKLIFAIALLPLFASAALACSCAEVSPCEYHGSASVVFVGIVTKMTLETGNNQLPSNAMSTTLTNTRPVTLLKVEETFGQTLTEVVQVYGQGTTCDLEFKPGERYLVYAYQDPNTKTLSTNICSGTAPLADRTDHLTYLRDAANSSGSTASGDIMRDVNGNPEPIAGAEIILVNGDRTFRGKADASGKFTLNGLIQGRYKVSTNPRTNYSHLDVMAKEAASEWEIEIPAHGCVKTWFVARPEGEIAGDVRDESGVVGDDLEPQLMRADLKPGEIVEPLTVKLDYGAFRFSFVRPGRYYLGFNLKGGPSLISPYPEFYYPGVTDRAQATVITVAEGQKITDLVFRRPMRLGERMLEGVAVWPDGKPYVEACGIQIDNPRNGYREGNCVSPDAQGRFKIKAVEGQTYNLSGTVVRPGSVALLRSKPLRVTVGKENAPVRLVVTMP